MSSAPLTSFGVPGDRANRPDDVRRRDRERTVLLGISTPPRETPTSACRCASGFRAVLARWDGLDRSSIGAFLIGVGTTLTSTVGGCSGPIWGTAFMRAGLTSKGCATVDRELLVAMGQSAVEGMMARGGASLGDKTLLDAVAPAIDALLEGRTGRWLSARGRRPRPRPLDRCRQGVGGPARPPVVHRRIGAGARSTPAWSRSRRCSPPSPPRWPRSDAAVRAPARCRTYRRRRRDEEVRERPRPFRPEMLEGLALANPATLRYQATHNIIYRADAPNDDARLDHPGLRQRPRAGARDAGRPGHARRRVPGQRVRGTADGLRATSARS